MRYSRRYRGETLDQTTYMEGTTARGTLRSNINIVGAGTVRVPVRAKYTRTFEWYVKEKEKENCQCGQRCPERDIVSNATCP